MKKQMVISLLLITTLFTTCSIPTKTPKINNVQETSDKTQEYTIANIEQITDPNNIRVLINKEYGLPSDYQPMDLVQLNIRFFNADFLARLRSEAAIHLEDMFKDAEKDFIYLYGVSGYRSYSYQQELYIPEDTYTAMPGHSEHQLGLSIDISNESIGCNLIEEFADSPEGIWLQNNCYKYGFIIRYPKEKEHITGYPYEPWHIRYVGQELAEELTRLNVTMEEYFHK